MIRLNDLHPQTRLDLIEETRWQYGSGYTTRCLEENEYIQLMCDWSKTRQGHKYWNWINEGMPKHQD
jgi:hypothetical protein